MNEISTCSFNSYGLFSHSFSTTIKHQNLVKITKNYFSETNKNDELLADEKQLKESEEYLKKALEKQDFREYLDHATTIYTIKQKLYGEKYEKGYFRDVRNMAYGNFILTNYTEALFYYDEALKFAQKDEEFLDVFVNLGQLYRFMNNDEAALDSFNQGYAHAKALYSVFLPKFDDSFAIICYNIANISRNLVEIHIKKLNESKAHEILEENIKIFTTIFKQPTQLKPRFMKDFLSHTFECCEEYSTIALKNKNLELAEKTIQQELDVAEKTKDLFYLARAYFNKGLVLTNIGKTASARAPIEKSKELLSGFIKNKPVEMYEEALLKEYEILMYMVYGALSDCYLKLEDKIEGLVLVDEIEQFYQKHPTQDILVYLHILNKKAEFLLLGEKQEEALKVLLKINENLDKLDKTVMKNQVFKTYILSMLTSVLGEVNRYQEALNYSLENEPIIRKIVEQYPDKKEALANLLYTTGVLYGKMKNYKESKRVYLEAIEKYKGLEGNMNIKVDIDRIYTDLAFLAEEEGNLRKAKEYFTLSLNLRKELANEGPNPLAEEVRLKISELDAKIEKN